MKPFKSFFKLSILITGLMFFLVSIANATTYYSYGNKDATQTRSWHGTRSNGGGNPSSFNNSSDLFVVQNGSNYSVSISAAWTVAGSVQIESGGNLTLSTSGTVLTGNMTVDAGGILSQQQNYASANYLGISGNLNIQGNYVYTGYAPAIFMNGPSGQTRNINTGTTSVYFLLLRTANYYANGNVTVDGPFYAMWNLDAGSFHTNGQTVVANWGVVNAGGTLFIDAGTLTINGNVGLLTANTVGGARATVNVSSGTLTTAGISCGLTESYISTFIHSGGTINTTNFSLSNSSTYTCSGSASLNVSGDLTVNSGTITTVTSGTPVINVTGNVNNSGTITNVVASNWAMSVAGNIVNSGNLTPAGTATIDLKGNWTNNGTAVATGGTVTFSGTGNSAINGSASTTFNYLTLNKSVSSLTVTNGSSDKIFTVNKDLTVTSGNLVLQASDNDYTFSNNVTVATNGTLTHSVSWDATGKKISIGGNLNVTGIFNPTVRSHVQLNGSGAHTLQTGTNAASTLSILTLTNGNFTVSGTLKSNQEAWIMFGSTGSFTTNGNNVTFGALLCNQGTINVNTGGTLTVNGGTQIDFGSGGAMNISAGTVNFNGDLTIGTSATVTCTNSPQINITGNWSNSGAFTPASSTVTFKGTGNQAIGGTSSTTFNNLTINNNAGVNISNDQTVNSTLSLTAGKLTIGSNNLVLGSSAAAVAGSPFSANNMIVADGTGEVRKDFSANGSYLFPIGDNTGTAEYSPITLNFTSGTYRSAYAGVKVTNAKHPNNASSTDYLKRYWTVSNSGITGPSFTASATYLTTDVNGTVGKIAAAKYTGALPWVKYGVLSANTLTTTAVTNTGTGIVFSGISDQLPLLSIPPAGFCAGSSTVLSPSITNGTNSMSYSWSPSTGLSSTTIANPTANPAANTTYTLNIKDGNGFTNSAVTTVVVNPLPATPTASVTSQPTCSVSTGTIIITAPTGMNYSIDGVTYTNTTGSFTGVNPGTYNVTAKNSNGCISSSTSVTVNAQPSTPSAPTITAGGPTTFCAGGSVTLASSAGTTYLWTNGATTASVTVNASGNYSVQVTNASGCQSAASTVTAVTVNALPATPTASVTSQPTCSVSTGTITITAPTGMNYSIDGVTDTNTTGSFTGVNPGTYNVTAKNGSGCISSATSVTVNALIQPSATISYSGSPFCAAAGNILPVISGTSGGVFTSTTGLSINGASGTISVVSSTPGNYTITYSIAATGACTVFTTTTSLTILAPGSWTGTISSDWNDPSNWVCGTIPTSAIDVIISAGLSYYPVITSGTGYARDITIQSGASLTISGGALQISGTISNSGNLNAVIGTIEMKGAAAQTIDGSMFTNKTIKNLIVSNTAVAGLSIASTLNDTLKITGTLSFGNSSSTLNTGGNLNLVSDSLGTASVGKVAAGNSINGQAIVERYINTGTVGGRHGKSWQFLSAPVNGQSIKQSWMENGVKTTNYGTMVSSPAGTAAGFDTVSVAPSVKYYIGSTNSWKGIPNTDTLVNNPLGYFVFVRGDRTVTKVNQAATATTLRAKGTLSVGTLAAINIKPDHFQSIGNPYASPVDFTLLTKSPTVDTLFYAWDPYLYGAYGVGGYQVLSNVNGWKPVPGGTSAYTSGISDSIIQSGQAFFVHATSSGHTMRTYGAAPTAAITFTENAKVSGGGTVNFARKAEKVSSTQLQALSVSLFTGPNKSDLMADGNSIVFGQNYSTSFDRNDAIKIANSGENFGVKNNGKLLAIDARAPLTVDDTLYYNMSNLAKRTYQLRFAPVNLQATGLQAFLIDNFLNTETSVSLSDSSFVDVAITSNAASAAAGRFKVVFRQMAALPIKITSVTATAKNSENLVEWKVENESGILQYEVEKSTDGNHFSQMSIANAKNTGTGNYNATDADVSPATNYYRIKSVSVDGKISYTQVVKVTSANATGSFSVYPNPIKDGIINLQLNNQPSGIYKIKLYNSAGQVLLSKNITHTDGSSKETINCENLPKGIYQLEVNMPNDNKEVIKIIK